MKKSTRKILNYSIAFIVSLCCVCLVLVLAVASSDSTLSTPTPALLLPQPNLSTIIAQTSSAAQLQTQALYSPTVMTTSTFTPTVTMLPTVTMPPTATLSVFELETMNALATYNANPTPTIQLIIFPTSNGEIYIPPSDGVCSCSDDTLSCKDFSSQNAAQACYNYCVTNGYGDIHRLDQGGQPGVVCETYGYP